METSDDNLFRKVHTLAQRQLEGALAPHEQREFAALLEESAAARRVYAEFVQETACIRWLCVDSMVGAPEAVTPSRGGTGSRTQPSPRRVAMFAFVAGLACTVAAAAVGWNYFLRPDSVAAAVGATAAPRTIQQPSIADQAVATITGLQAVRWLDDNVATSLLTRCRVGDRLQLREGAAELTFDAGVQLTVFGPADFEITSPTSIRCVRGRTACWTPGLSRSGT